MEVTAGVGSRPSAQLVRVDLLHCDDLPVAINVRPFGSVVGHRQVAGALPGVHDLDAERRDVATAVELSGRLRHHQVRHVASTVIVLVDAGEMLAGVFIGGAGDGAIAAGGVGVLRRLPG